MYSDIFFVVIEKKEAPWKMDNLHLVCPSRQCSSKPVGFGQEFLYKGQVTRLEYLLTWIQLIFTCFLDWNQHWSDGVFVTILISLWMRRKSWKDFYAVGSRSVSKYLQHLCCLWHKCIVAQADCFEGTVPWTIVMFCISHKRNYSVNILKLPNFWLQRLMTKYS